MTLLPPKRQLTRLRGLFSRQLARRVVSRVARELSELRPRRPVPVFYDPAYRLPLGSLEAQRGVEPRRADLALWYLQERKAVLPTDLRDPRRVSFEELARVHSDAYLESLMHPETLAAIFAVDVSEVPTTELLRAVRLACGATVDAARLALRLQGPTLNLLGGFHHASPDHGAGFCAVNDMAVAVATLRHEGFAGQVVVIDLDAHPPDGTAKCFEALTGCFIGSLSGSHWGAVGADETLLPEGCGDEEYLAALRALLSRMPRPELAFVIAGGDVLAGDRLGKLGLSLDGARRRDLAVAGALEGIASVWLPGGGYHRDGWKVLAGTALALTRGSRKRISRRADPLRSRFAFISRDMPNERLGSDSFITQEDVEEMFGGTRHKNHRLFGFYTPEGMEYALFRFGVLAQLERLGYRDFKIAFDVTDAGERITVTGRAAGVDHVLIETVLSRNTIAGGNFLFVNWLSLRNPRAKFSDRRPRLPGQEVPGLGLAREASEMLALMAKRLGLDGVAYRPAWFHVAYSGRHRLRFVDPVRQGRFEALVRDLKQVPLLELTRAVADGRARLNGMPWRWEPEPMADRRDVLPDDERLAREERDRSHFTLAALEPGKEEGPPP